MNFPDHPLRAVTESLTERTGLRFAAETSEEVWVSVRMRDVPLLDLVAILAETSDTHLCLGPGETLTFH